MVVIPISMTFGLPYYENSLTTYMRITPSFAELNIIYETKLPYRSLC